MSQEKFYDILNYLFVGTTAGGAGAVTFIQSLTGVGVLIVQGISILTFICFYLMNQDRIHDGWKKFIAKLPKLRKNANSQLITKERNILKN